MGPGLLPPDGFVWRLFLVLAVHVGGLFLIISNMSQAPVVILGGEPGGGLAPAELPEINWIDPSVVSSVEPIAAAPEPVPASALLADEPPSAIPLPVPAPVPEIPKPEPPKEIVLKPIPKPEPPKEIVLKPIPKPAPPKEVGLKPVPKPAPPKEVALKPVSKPAPPKEVALKPVPKPIAPKLAEATAALIDAPPVARPVVASPIRSSSTIASGSGSGGAGGSFGSGPGGGGGPMDAVSAFHLKVKDAYFSQWQQPHGLIESGSKYRVRTEVVLGREGNVVSARIVSRSGNAEMDQSVQEAVNRVTQVASLPSGVGGATYTVLLNFDI